MAISWTTYYWEDGQTHTLDSTNPIYRATLYIDGDHIVTPPNPGTEVLIVEGAYVEGSVLTWNNSSVIMTGGTVERYLTALNYSTIEMHSGSIHALAARDYGDISMYDGTVDYDFSITQDGRGRLYNGWIGTKISVSSSGGFAMYGGSVENFISTSDTEVYLHGGEVRENVISEGSNTRHWSKNKSTVAILGGSIGNCKWRRKSAALAVAF